MGFDPSYVSHIESGRHRPTEDFARRAEAVLRTGGQLWQQWQEYDLIRRRDRAHDGDAGRALGWPARPGGRDGTADGRYGGATGLLVEREEAELVYVEGTYRARIRRHLYNASAEPVSRYLVRISVDRYPGEPERSNRLYREHPLTWDELDLTASCAGEPMAWRAKHDRDAFKEVWLLFENARGLFPLYPGQRTWIEYSYGAGADKWGHFFQRAVRVPTRALAVRLVFPLALQPVVWGVHTSLTAESAPLRTPIESRHTEEQAIFEWATDEPPLHARFRLEWRFRGAEAERRSVIPVRASARMRAAGIVQRGSDILRRTCRPFDLPGEVDTAREVVDRLFTAMHRATGLHVFVKGAGLAAPQIGVDRAVAVIQPADEDAEPIVLVNPRVVAESPDTDERYEGCLSFFDVRGLVPRPLRLEVEHTTVDGRAVITAFESALARLVAHEVDHLYGRLYTDRMLRGRALIPVEEYSDTGRPWHY